MKLIDKATVLAEIERRIDFCDKLADAAAENNLHNSLEANELLIAQYGSLLSFLDILEVKEVGNVWHDVSEIPKGAGDKEILVQFTDYHASVLEIDDWEYLDHQTKWAYLKDLT